MSEKKPESGEGRMTYRREIEGLGRREESGWESKALYGRWK